MATVQIATTSPTGLHLQLYTPQGVAAVSGQFPQAPGFDPTFAIIRPASSGVQNLVDSVFWAQWVLENAQNPLYLNGVVFEVG